ncbi:hypothetical protein D3C73_1034020 [compost metagenome]
MNDQQVVIFSNQRDGGFAAEINVSLVDNQHPLRILLKQHPDLFQRQWNSSRRIRIRQNDSAIGHPVS